MEQAIERLAVGRGVEDDVVRTDNVQFAVFRLVLDWSVKPTVLVGQSKRMEDGGPF